LRSPRKSFPDFLLAESQDCTVVIDDQRWKHAGLVPFLEFVYCRFLFLFLQQIHILVIECNTEILQQLPGLVAPLAGGECVQQDRTPVLSVNVR